MATLEIEFVGMFVVVEQKSERGITVALSVGALDEPGHVHLMQFRDGSGSTRIQPLLRGTGVIDIPTQPNAGPQGLELKTNNRLRDVSLDGSGLNPGFRQVEALLGVRPRFSAEFVFAGGTLEALEAQIGDAASTWAIGSVSGVLLTDRLRFKGTVPNSELALHAADALLSAEGDLIRVVVSAIDGDIADHSVTLQAGFPLTEYAAFYELTNSFGPIPIAEPTAAASRAGKPLCPTGYIVVPQQGR